MIPVSPSLWERVAGARVRGRAFEDEASLGYTHLDPRRQSP